jgi:hypothetical protein
VQASSGFLPGCSARRVSAVKSAYQERTARMQKWEYLQVGMVAAGGHIDTLVVNGKSTAIKPKWSMSDFWEHLNKLGKEGWEMINGGGIVFYFKRPIE